jgi:hypothetical protein
MKHPVEIYHSGKVVPLLERPVRGLDNLFSSLEAGRDEKETFCSNITPRTGNSPAGMT